MKLIIIIVFYATALIFIFFSKKIIPNKRIRIPVISVLGILVGVHMLLGAMGYMMEDRKTDFDTTQVYDSTYHSNVDSLAKSQEDSLPKVPKHSSNDTKTNRRP